MKRENSALIIPQKRGMRPKGLVFIHSRVPRGSAVEQGGHGGMALPTVWCETPAR